MGHWAWGIGHGAGALGMVFSLSPLLPAPCPFAYQLLSLYSKSILFVNSSLSWEKSL